MSIEVLIPTHHKSIEDIIEIVKKSNSQSHTLVCNQVDKESTKEIGDNLKIVNINNIGVSNNRNNLLHNASQDICICIDDDCRLVDNYIDIVNNFFISHPDAEFILFNGIVRKENNRLIHNKKTKKVTHFNDISYGGGPGLVFRRDVINKYNLEYDTSVGYPNYICLGEDTLFLYNLVKKGVRVYRSSEVLFSIEDDVDNSIYFKGVDESFLISKGYITSIIHPHLKRLYVIKYALHLRHWRGNTYSLYQLTKMMGEGFNYKNIMIKNHYNYLIVGCGLFGATFAQQVIEKGMTVLIIDKRNHIGGNVYTEEIENIHVHRYGAHIFHTSYDNVWEYVNRFATFNNFVNNVIADYKGERYHLPFNMNTFHELWGVDTAEEAQAIINKQIKDANIKEITNLEEQAISMVGTDIYNKLIKGYTEKQWGRSCKELPPFIIKRLPLRFTYDNNYFNDKYQGIPIGGYTKMIEKMIVGADVLLNTIYKDFIKDHSDIADKIIYTGPIDEYFNYSLGKLEYRTVRFENELIDKPDYQGNAVINYTEKDIPFTRIIEHKYFDLNDKQTKTYISKEYPSEYKDGMEPYYPVNNDKNASLYNKYLELAKKEENVFFKGRLGEYNYYDMDDVILSGLLFAIKIL